MAVRGMENNLIHNAIISKVGIPRMKKALDLASVRQKITAGNMANVQTIGYNRRFIDFEKELQKLVKPDRLAGVRTHSSHIPIGRQRDGGMKIHTDRTRSSEGPNNVNVEQEMADLAQTQLWYQLGTTLVRKKFSGLRLAITGGNR